MTRAKIPATAVAIATYVIVSGIFTQSGVVLQAAAAWFHASVTGTAVIFSYAYAGNLAGIVTSSFAFNVLSVRRVLVLAYTCTFAGVGTIVVTHALPFAFAAFFAIGLGVGTGLSAGAVVLAKLYVDRPRAVAFLATDCAFSATGFAIPAASGAALERGWPWQSGYVLVAAIAATVLLTLGSIRFPATSRTAADASETSAAPRRRASVAGVALYASALAFYLTGQTVFTIWAPTVLERLLAVPAATAGTIVGSFFGPSSLGLITAALVVTRVSPRFVLAVAVTAGALLTLALATTADARLFFFVTYVFGFSTTCMYKLMISIGSEQVPNSPPSLVTLLLFISGLGGVVAPVISARVVDAYGLHASLWMSFACYVATLAAIAVALVVERRGRWRRPDSRE